MRSLLLFLFLFAVLEAPAQQKFSYKKDFKNILARTKDSKDELFYDNLLKRFRKNDATLTSYEVLALLIGFTDKPEYKPYDDLSTERKIYGFNDAGEYQSALDTADLFLRTHPLSQLALIERSFAFYKLGNKDSADFYMVAFRLIMKAMDFSGEGTISSPIFALGPTDGQNYIRKHLSADIGIMGSGQDKNGNFLDILEAKFEDGKTKNYYFVIQHATDKMFGGKSIEDELRELEKKDKDGKKKKD
jgi:hypothetical protein